MRLVVGCDNSKSGKTTTALAVRTQLVRTCALVQQDVICRTMVKKRDIVGGMQASHECRSWS